MPRFLTRIGNFFRSRTFAGILVGVVLFLILLYLEEDWRGTHAWALTKARWEAQGESFEPSKFVPPPVPDDQNIAALPLFKLEKTTDSEGQSELYDVTLRHALRGDLRLEYHPPGNWFNGELADMAVLRKDLTANVALVGKTPPPPGDVFAQFNTVYPFFNDFLTAASTRPCFRVNLDYTVEPPAARVLGPVVDAIGVAKILSLHAMFAIDQRQPELALLDIKTDLTLATGAGRDPSLVGGLVALGVVAINNGAIYDGLARHAWNDAQLDDLEKALRPIDLLASYQFSMRAEAVNCVENFEVFKRINQAGWKRLFGWSTNESPVISLIDLPPLPSGWWDNNKRLVVDFDLHLVATVDPQAHLCFPRLANQVKDQADQARVAWDSPAPWKIFAAINMEPMSGGSKKFAEGQVWVDEMRIACALERYHLAHLAYPDSLDALAPAYLAAVPHDPMSGKPYRYALRADGSFLLYSVGWNQVDDGGTVAFEKTNPKSIDYDNGDWIWPTPKLPR